MTGSFALLKQRRFLPLFVTQLLGAFNDNLFKNAMVLFVVYGVFNDEASETLFSAVATALVPVLGYDDACALAARARAQGRSVRAQAIAEGLVDDERFDELLRPEAVLRLGMPGPPTAGGGAD